MNLSQRTTTGTDAQRHSGGSPSSAAQAASSLALLLREDRLLTEYGLHLSAKSEESAFSYASALLENEDATHHEVMQRATDALAEVHRKLALVESLAERVSRTSPEAVAGPLLRMHGYSVDASEVADGTSTRRSTATTLAAVRERSERLKRQGEVLEGVARRVEMSLERGMKQMETVTSRLSRVLLLSATLKMILRLKFEASKLNSYDMDDPRDLTRAAASVAVVEDLLARPELKGSHIEVVEEIWPSIRKTSAAVRAAASKLLERHHENASLSMSSAVMLLGTTLQVYYHLGELPQATWKAVDHAVATAENVTAEFFSAETISKINENATVEAKRAAGSKAGESSAQRVLKKKQREFRAAAASKWGSGITDAALQVWNLQRVLCRKTDPVARVAYIDVVAAAEIPIAYQTHIQSKSGVSVFSLFWERMCSTLADSLVKTLVRDNKKLSDDTAALYPAVRSASLDMMGFLQDIIQAGVGIVSLDDGTSTTIGSILGGSAALDDSVMGWSFQTSPASTAHAVLGVTGADTWTRNGTDPVSTWGKFVSSANISLSAILQSSEWQALEGSSSTKKGLYPLQRAFQEASMQRLCTPFQYLFPEIVTLDDTGLAASTLPLLPSKYDVQKFDEIIRQELSLADPREGGGDLSAVKMIAGTICEMVETFCKQANNAVCNPADDACLTAEGLWTNMMAHDIKVTKILYTLMTYLKHTPEKTFVSPYRPATTQQHEAAASICQSALEPAIRELEKMAKMILSPLVRALNRRVAAKIARVNTGVYKEVKEVEVDGRSFVQQHLAVIFEGVAKNQLVKLPSEYSSMVATTVSAFSIYTYVSSVSLVRPIGESARLLIIQDLADLELILEQFVAKSGGTVSLSQIDGGKPYAELRAVRQMLFWSGLDNKENPDVIAKALLRESWIKDVRPSTVCHFLFSYAPSLLSSPHHSKRLRAEDYVRMLIGLDASFEDGEAQAWVVIMACCDAYRQRESAGHGDSDGDPRVAHILMTIGPELLRPRPRHH